MTRSKISLMETATERIGRMLSDNYGIRVVYKHDQCSTDGETIFLPVLGENADQSLIDAFPGIIDHESSHVLKTDFDVLNKYNKSKDQERVQVLELCNTVEDARVENYMTKLWVGTKVNLRKCHDWAYNRLLHEGDKDKQGNFVRYWDQITDWGKVVQLCAVVACHDDDYSHAIEMISREPELWEYVSQVKDMLKSGATQPDTAASLQLSKDILKKLQDLVGPPSPQPQEGDDEEDKKEEEGDGGGEEDKKEEEGDGGGEEGDDESESEEKEGGPECLQKGYERTPEEESKDHEVCSLQEQIKKAAGDTCPQHSGQYLVYTTERDVIVKITGGDQQEASKLLRDSSHITSVMRQKMMRNLLSVNKVRWEANQERGRINPRALHRIVTGTSKKVFRKRVEAPKFDTRASIWVDHSASMSGKKIVLAQGAALLFGEVLNLIGIPFEVCGYSTSTSWTEGGKIFHSASAEDKKIFTRWGGQWVGVYKGFNDNWGMTRHHCVQMSKNIRHNTFDGESIKIGAQRLLAYPERRRIMFVLNDGDPCPNVQQFIRVHDDHAKNVAAEVHKAVELFAIGIMSETVSNYYPNSVCINKLKDLPLVMVGELDRLLRKMQKQLMAV